MIIKQIPLEYLRNKEERQAALNEVKVLSMLDHPNIIEYYENFLEDKALMIVMEYAEGENSSLPQGETRPLTSVEAVRRAQITGAGVHDDNKFFGVVRPQLNGFHQVKIFEMFLDCCPHSFWMMCFQTSQMLTLQSLLAGGTLYDYLCNRNGRLLEEKVGVSHTWTSHCVFGLWVGNLETASLLPRGGACPDPELPPFPSARF